MSDLRKAAEQLPPVKTYCGGKPNYVDEVDISEKRVDESDKSIHEFVAAHGQEDFK